jgi:hypothetical protein
MRYYLKTVFFDDGSQQQIDLTFASMDAALDWVILLCNQEGKKRHWYKFTMSVSPLSFK